MTDADAQQLEKIEIELLRGRISETEGKIAADRKRLNELYGAAAERALQRVRDAYAGRGAFAITELRFAAYSRCSCEAGLAYPVCSGPRGAWHCSAILLGTASRDLSHTPELPFTFYEVKSEDQPSANGATTRS